MSYTPEGGGGGAIRRMSERRWCENCYAIAADLHRVVLRVVMQTLGDSRVAEEEFQIFEHVEFRVSDGSRRG
jgi:hypothetical protein